MPFRQIQTAVIADNAVNSAKIGVDVIVAADLAANSVTVSEIQDGAVTAAKLAPGAAVPDQTGHAGQFLTTDGTTADWANTGAINDVFWENAQTLATSYSIPTGKSAVTAGPVTLGSGVTVTLGATSRWVIV
jgi:hypothetical protein